ncbi:MAG: hypothetical protein ACRD4V_06805 [Candidatus Acidiferrales bacterium]
MTAFQAATRREERHHAHPAPTAHGHLDCIHASRREHCESAVEPLSLFAEASASLRCFRENVMDSLFPICTTTRSKEKIVQVL